MPKIDFLGVSAISSIIPYFEGVCETHVILTPGAVEVGLLTALHDTTLAGKAGSVGERQKRRCCCVLQYKLHICSSNF